MDEQPRLSPDIPATLTGVLAKKTKTEELDAPLHTLGFEIDELSPSIVSGTLLVTPKCCQPFKVLHGGVSAMIAEALASIGAYLACGFKRVAGVHLGIHHMRSAELGDLVLAQATPLSNGRTVQLLMLHLLPTWEVFLGMCLDRQVSRTNQTRPNQYMGPCVRSSIHSFIPIIE